MRFNSLHPYPLSLSFLSACFLLMVVSPHLIRSSALDSLLLSSICSSFAISSLKYRTFQLPPVCSLAFFPPSSSKSHPSLSLDARFNSHETYARPDSDLPREYEKWPADFHIYEYGALWDNSPVLDGKVNQELEVLPFSSLLSPFISPLFMLSVFSQSPIIPPQKLYSRVVRFFPDVPPGRPGALKPWDNGRHSWRASPSPTLALSSLQFLSLL